MFDVAWGDSFSLDWYFLALSELIKTFRPERKLSEVEGCFYRYASTTVHTALASGAREKRTSAQRGMIL